MKQLSFTKTEYRRCAVTGHRELPEDFQKEALKDALEALVLEGVECFYDGMAIGFDLAAAQAILSLKEKYPHVRLIACVPFFGQESKFPQKQRAVYTDVLKRCDEVVVLSPHYYGGCYFKRNDYMVEQADVLFAYCVRRQGGTAYTVRTFAKKKGEENVVYFE